MPEKKTITKHNIFPTKRLIILDKKFNYYLNKSMLQTRLGALNINAKFY